MRPLFQAVLLLCACCSQAQSVPRSLLWEVSRPGDSGPSYLFGTLHSRDSRVFQFQDSVLIALDRCDVLAGELEVDETRKMDPSTMNAMFLPNGRSLDRLYSKKDYKRVIAVLKDRLGPLAPLCTRIRPFYSIAMLSEMQLGSDSAEVLDAWLQTRARAHGKKVIGLETINEQLAAVERIPLREQARLLLELVEREDEGRHMDEVVQYYCAGDLERSMALIDRDGMPEHADKALLAERNARMADRAEKQINARHRVFVAVGAAHLAGPSGIIELLRAKGMQVRAVGASQTDTTP